MSIIESLPDAEQSTPVTLCPAGKRSREVMLRAPVESPIPVTTATALKWPEKPRLVPPAANDRRPAQERVEAAQRAEAMSVALNQPGRAGADDPESKLLESSLGRFCIKAWPRRTSDAGYDLNAGHRWDMMRGGQIYGEIVHKHRVLLGLGGGAKTQPEGMSVAKSEAQAIADLEKMRIKRDDADAELRAIHSGAISAIMRLCVDEMDPTPYQEDLARHCLWALAVHFGVVKLGRFAGIDAARTA